MSLNITLTGIAGTAGASVLSGSGAPSSALGNIGDTYIDVSSTAAIYKKTITGWGTGVSLIGTRGLTGASIIGVNGAPAAGVGNAGDYAFDPNTSLLYGPKDATTGWPTPLSLKGNDGVTQLAALSTWTPGTVYQAKAPSSFVSYNGSSYCCIVPHTSGSSFDPLKWIVVAGQGQTGPMSFAPAVVWTAGASYSSVAPMSIVTYQGSAWLCAQGHIAGGAFDATKWTQLVAKGDVGSSPFAPIVAWAATTAYTNVAPASAVFYSGNVYICSTPHTSSASFDVSKFTLLLTSVLPFLAPTAWATGAVYTNVAPASAVYYGGSTYVCITGHTAGASFDPTKWTILAAQGQTGGAGAQGSAGPSGAPGPAAWQLPPVAWAASTAYSAAAPASLVIFSGLVYLCKISHTSGASFTADNFVQVSAQGSFVSTNISDSTQAGRALLSAASVQAQRLLLIIDDRIAVADQNYAASSPIAMIAYTSITATRQATLPPANTYNPGQICTVVDESGGCSATVNINVLAGSSDTVNGASGTSIITKYGYVAMESDGVSRWTIVDSCNFAFISSPAFQGSPTAPTPAVNDNSLRIATTAWYAGQAGAANPVIAGTAAPGTSLLFARQDHVHPSDTTRAPVNSPTLTGAPKSVTPAVNDNSVAIATTAFYAGQAGTANPIVSGTAAPGTSLLFARQDHVHPTDTSRAPVANPTFTGTVQVPTALSTDVSLTAANTSFVAGAIAALMERTEVADVPYTALATDRTVAVTSLTASRVITLPAASAYPKGTTLEVIDETGNCTATKTITLSRAGTDVVNGTLTAVIASPYGFLQLESNGTNKWTVTGAPASVTSGLLDGAFGSTTGAILMRSTSGWAILPPAAAGGVLKSQGAGAVPAYAGMQPGFRNLICNSNFTVNQRAMASGTSLAANKYGLDRWRGGASTGTIYYSNSGIDVLVQITGGTMNQPIEASTIEGGTYTLSWAGTATGRVYQGNGSGITYAASPITVTLTANTQTYVEFASGTVTQVQLETGSYASPYERRPRFAEQAMCWRYYQQRVLGMRATVGSNLVAAYPYCLPFPMASTPVTTRLSTVSSTNVSSANMTMQNSIDAKYAVVATAQGDLLTTGDLFSFDAELI